MKSARAAGKMDHAKWEAWGAAEGALKKRLFAELVASNEPLVQWVAYAFGKRSRYRMDRDDLLQAARIGIMEAIQKWEPVKGAFSALAFRWAWHEMQQISRHATAISIPKKAFLPKAKQDEAAAFAAKNGREPEPAEIGLTEAAVERSHAAQVRFVGGDYVLADSASEDDLLEELDFGASREMVLAYLQSRPAGELKRIWDRTPEQVIQAAVAWSLEEES